MLIFRSKYIESPNFVNVNSVEEINKTTTKDILLIDFKPPFELAKYCKENSLTYAIEANSAIDAIYASNLESSFAIADIELAQILQKLADNYLWDMKILVKIKEKEIEKVAMLGIDGAYLIKECKM